MLATYLKRQTNRAACSCAVRSARIWTISLTGEDECDGSANAQTRTIPCSGKTDCFPAKYIEYAEHSISASLGLQHVSQLFGDQLPPHLDSESSDILLHLAGVNEYRGLRVVGGAGWKACGRSHQIDGPRGS